VRNFHRLRALERKLGRPAEQVPRGLVIVEGNRAEIQSFSGRFPVTKTMLIKGNDESPEQFDRRVAKAAEEIPALVMSRAEYEEIEARLLREVQGLE
jgi:hypothetical protein